MPGKALCEMQSRPLDPLLAYGLAGGMRGHKFKRWRKKQSTVYLSVSVPKDKVDAVRAAIKAAGGTVSA